ncbi:MAG: hypothetical protein QOF77_153 [Solirubrobacteraceae bacterium]|nr:hypothetical protein [Solirubrobacteraceae bacterium]
MAPAERRALVFFASCIVVSLVLGGVDLAGVHSLALRIAAMFSLVIGIAVLLIRASQKQRADREG